MKQIKVTRKNDKFYFEIKCQKHQTLCRSDIETIAKIENGSFLSFQIDDSKNPPLLHYNANGFLTLPEFLKVTMLSKRLFIYIVKQYLNLWREIENNHLKKSSVLLDSDGILINPSSWSISFIYVPIQPFDATCSLCKSLKDLIQYAVFDENDDLSYVDEFIKITANEVAFSVYQLEAYIAKNSVKKETKTEKKFCPYCNYPIEENDTVCPMCEKSIIKPQREEESIVFEENPKDVIIHNEDKKTIGEYALGYTDNGSVTVFKAASNYKKSILRLKTSKEIIEINRFPFRIGKQEDKVDYCVNNRYVSRKHVEFVREYENFYIIDLNSTNGTLLDGRKLQPGVKEKIKSGSNLVIANQAFEISIVGD